MACKNMHVVLYAIMRTIEDAVKKDTLKIIKTVIFGIIVCSSKFRMERKVGNAD